MDKFSVAESVSEKTLFICLLLICEESNYLIAHNINRTLTKYKLFPSDNRWGFHESKFSYLWSRSADIEKEVWVL